MMAQKSGAGYGGAVILSWIWWRSNTELDMVDMVAEGIAMAKACD